VKGKIMDKKYLLSGGAALLLAGGMFVTSASASAIDFRWEGEATLSAVFDDHCSQIDYDVTVDTADTNWDLNNAVTDVCADGDVEDLPIWSTGGDLDWYADGTLANGLGVSIGKNGSSVGLSGAFGSVTWEDGGDSAVKAALPNSAGDLDVSGQSGFGGHALKTAGTAGYVVNYSAPSVGGMDLFVSYAPGSAATNTDDYLDTLAFGAKMTAGDITIGAGWETATANANAADGNACVGADAADGAAADLLTMSQEAFQGQSCGDQTLMGLGASMAAGGIDINAGYTKLDTEGGDTTTYNIGLATSMGEYSLGLDYVNSTGTYESTDAAVADSVETVIGVNVGTNLGDGVDLGISFHNQSMNVMGTGAHTNYRAEAKLTITY